MPKRKARKDKQKPDRESLFKLTYQVDFEYFQELVNGKYTFSPAIEITIVLDERAEDTDTTVDHDINYLQTHLPAVIDDAIRWLYFMEAPAAQGVLDEDILQRRKKQRIEDVVKLVRKRIRQRERGAPRKEKRTETSEERIMFERLFAEAAQLTLGKGKERSFTKNQIALVMGTMVENQQMSGLKAYDRSVRPRLWPPIESIT